jgi:hypothetical protein
MADAARGCVRSLGVSFAGTAEENTTAKRKNAAAIFQDLRGVIAITLLFR